MGTSGGHQAPGSRHQATPAPERSDLLRSSLGHCGQHLIPTEWFSSLRPAREGSGRLDLPTACLTPWLQPAGDSFPQGGCQQLSWSTLRVSVRDGQKSWVPQETCTDGVHTWASCGGSSKVLHMGPSSSLVPPVTL